jgi:hypothetical protein
MNSSSAGRSWIERGLLFGFFLLLLLGISALIAFLFLMRTPAEPEILSPLDALQTEQISPSLALQELAGDPASALGYQALQAGELATAQAIALFDTQQMGTTRAAFNSQLARRLQDERQSGSTAVAQQMLRALAVLDPAIPPFERSQLLTQAAAGFLALDAPDAALDAADQAMLVGARTPDFLPAQRQQIFEDLQPIAAELDAEPFTAQLADLTRNPFLTPTGILITPQLFVLTEAVAYDQPLQDAIAARQQATRQLAERIRFTNGADIGPEQEALGALLLQEERMRQEFYARTEAEVLAPGQQLWLQLDRRAWLSLKTRIAMGGFGLSLVPEWEMAVNALQQELAQNAGAVDVAAKAVAVALDEPAQQAMLQVEILQWLALQAELGLFPNAPVVDINERLHAAQLAFAQFGQEIALPIFLDETAIPPGFRIQP